MAYSDVVLATTGISTYWKLGETVGTTAADSQDSATGTYTGGYTLGVTGIPGSADTAVSFNGTTGYINVPDTAAIDLGNTFSLEFWIKRGSTGSVQVLAGKGPTGGYTPAIESNNKPTFYGYALGGSCESSVAITDTTTWHHVVFVAGGGVNNDKIYVDGADVTVTLADLTFLDTTAALIIGADNGPSTFYNGALSNVAFYTVALSGATILAHYNAGISLGSGTGYGDGSYGDGTYGVRTTTTPKAGTESFGFTESASLQITASRTDTWTVTDANSGISLTGPAETFGFSDVAALSQLFAVTDALTQTEGVPSIGISASDSWLLSEVSSLANTLNATDALTITEGIPQIAQAVTDLWTLSEASAIATALAATDAWALSDASALVAQLARTDAWTLSEASAIAAALAASDLWTLSEVSSASQLLSVAASDTWTLSEVSALAQALSATDTATQSEGASSILANLAALDTFTLAELTASTVALSVTDPAVLAEAAALANALGVSDSFSLTENKLLTITQQIIASDLATLAESASVVPFLGVAPDVQLPTTANIAVWLASAILAEKFAEVALANSTRTALVVSKLSEANVIDLKPVAVIAPYQTRAIIA